MSEIYDQEERKIATRVNSTPNHRDSTITDFEIMLLPWIDMVKPEFRPYPKLAQAHTLKNHMSQKLSSSLIICFIEFTLAQ